MTRSMPYLALDSAGKRTILCDYPIKMFDNTTKKETPKMKTMSNSDAAAYASLFVKNRAVANRFWAKCMGQDAAMDDETVEKLKGFLKNKLTAEDHEQVCNMLAGDVEAQDTESPPYDVDAEPRRKLAGDAASFNARFPGLSHVRLDNSGIAISKRASGHSDAAAASFAARFPDLARIKLA